MIQCFCSGRPEYWEELTVITEALQRGNNTTERKTEKQGRIMVVLTF